MVLSTRVNGLPTARPFGFVPAEIDKAFEQLVNGTGRSGSYPVDVREDENKLYFEAELPGLKKEEIEITLENQLLSITAERKAENAGEVKGEVLISERRNETFSRSFRLPATIDGNTVNARLQDGVLYVTLNKREDTKPRRIEVS